MAAKGMKYVVALTPFYDKKEGVNRAAGEEFEVTEERMAELNACGAEQGGVPLVNETVREPLSPAGKRAAKEKAEKK